jgi:ankyrin repeat protein
MKNSIMLSFSILCNLNIAMEKEKDRPNTPLHNAILDKDINTVRSLLAKEANPNKQNSKGETPLHLAVQTDNLAYITPFLEQFSTNLAIPDNNGKFARDYATANTKDHLNRSIKEKTLPTMYRDGERKIFYFFSWQITQSTKHIREKSKIISSPLSRQELCDISNGYTLFFKHIPETSYFSLLPTDVCNEILSRLQLQLQKELIIQEEEANYFITLVNKNSCYRLQKELPYCTNPNAQNEHGQTPLHIAAQEGKYECIRILLTAANIDRTRTNLAGKTPADIAKNNEIKKLLVVE